MRSEIVRCQLGNYQSRQGYVLGTRLNHTSSRSGLLSRATLGWADEASAPTRISPLRGLRRATSLAPKQKAPRFHKGLFEERRRERVPSGGEVISGALAAALGWPEPRCCRMPADPGCS